MTRTKLLILGVIVVGLGAGLTVGILLITGREKPPGVEKVTTVQVKFVHPRKGALERLCVQPGSVHSFASVQLFAEVAGFLKVQTVDIGYHVKAGALLAQVDVPDIEAQVERNKAAVEKARAQLDQMKSRVDVAIANLDALEAAVTHAIAKTDSAKAWVKYRKIQLGRMTDLAKTSSVEERLVDESTKYYEASVETENAARAEIASAKADVVAGKAKIEQARSDVVEAEAEIKVASAELKKSDETFKFATIRAPFPGVITYRSMNPGDFVRAANSGANINPLLTIQRSDLFRVVVLVPDRDAERISVGMPARLRIDSLPGRTFKDFKVSRIAESLDPNTRLMRVELDLPNEPDGKIYHGMYGEVAIVLDRGMEQLSIPTSCLAGKVEDGKGSIYVIRSGRAKKIEVKLGLDSGLRVVVEKVLTRDEALTVDDRVIIEPSSDLARQPEVIAMSWDDPPTIQTVVTDK
jgi:RND family efflux transporter MFP subunit